MKLFIIFVSICCCWSQINGAPPNSRHDKDIFLVPSSIMTANSYYRPPHPGPFQVRGPFDFIGNWIQGSDWFPIEINVPDTAAAIGQGVGQFATGAASNFNQFTQGVGNNLQNFLQTLTNRFPALSNVVRPTATTTVGGQKMVVWVPVPFPMFPSQQQTVLANQQIMPPQDFVPMQNMLQRTQIMPQFMQHVEPAAVPVLMTHLLPSLMQNEKQSLNAATNPAPVISDTKSDSTNVKVKNVGDILENYP